jgi:hypothetical protein
LGGLCLKLPLFVIFISRHITGLGSPNPFLMKGLDHFSLDHFPTSRVDGMGDVSIQPFTSLRIPGDRRFPQPGSTLIAIAGF